MIKGLTLYQILGKLTSQTKKDLKSAGNKDQTWQVRRYSRRFMDIFAKKNQCPSEQFKVTQVNFRINGFLTQKVEQGYAPFLYHVKQLTSGGSSPDASCTLFQVRKRLGTSKSIQMTQKETWMNWQNKLWMRISCAKKKHIQSWKDAKTSNKESWSEVYFNASDPSVTNDDGSPQFSQWLLHCFGKLLSSWKIHEIHLESRHNSLQLSSLQESRRTSLSLDLMQLTISQFVLRWRRETSWQEHHL